MLYKSKAVVLHKINYSDTSIIVHLFTEKIGKQTFIIKGAKRKNAKLKSSLFQPLFLLEIEASHSPSKNLQILKEVRIEPVLHSITENLNKSAISIFLAEILFHSLNEELNSNEIFNYIYNSIQILELTEHNISNFHIQFLIGLTKYLGFYPDNNFKETYFDLINGTFSNTIPLHNHYIDKEVSGLLQKFLKRSSQESISLTSEQRFLLLQKIIEYYKIHIPSFGDIKSLDVLNALFHYV